MCSIVSISRFAAACSASTRIATRAIRQCEHRHSPRCISVRAHAPWHTIPNTCGWRHLQPHIATNGTPA